MTDQEARTELERVVKDVYPLIASRFIDTEIMLRAAKEISYEVKEWRGTGFPYRQLEGDFRSLVSKQFRTTSCYDITYNMGERIVIGFLNRYYHWHFEEEREQSKALAENEFELSD